MRRSRKSNQELTVMIANTVMDAACGDRLAVERVATMIRLPDTAWGAFAEQLAARSAELRRIAGLPSDN